MKIMDMLIEEMNKSLTEEEKAQGAKFERLHTAPVELVETPSGISYRDPKTGKFTRKDSNE